MQACLAHYEKVESNEFQEYDFIKEYHNKIMYLFTTLKRTDELCVCWSLMEKTRMEGQFGIEYLKQQTWFMLSVGVQFEIGI